MIPVPKVTDPDVLRAVARIVTGTARDSAPAAEAEAPSKSSSVVQMEAITHES